jgi:hypothetical protein
MRPAAVPLAVGMFAILGSMAVMRAITFATEVSVFALNLTLALGLALAAASPRPLDKIGPISDIPPAGEDTIHVDGTRCGALSEAIGSAVRSLQRLQERLDAIRVAALDNALPNSGQRRHRRGHIPFTKPAKKVLELSLREALASRGAQGQLDRP